MLKGTTQIYLATLNGVNVVDVNSIRFTFKGYGTVRKEYPTDVSYTEDDGIFGIPLTQEDTIKLCHPSDQTTIINVEAQINYKDKSVSKQKADDISIDDSIATLLIKGNTPSASKNIQFKIVDNVIIASVEGAVTPEMVSPIVDEIVNSKDLATKSDVTTEVSSYVTTHKDELKGDQGPAGPKGEQGIQGIQGETGAKGDKGDTGEKGEKGEKGDAGADGANGQDGYTPVKGVDYFDGKDGKDGANGQDGKDGKDLTLQPFNVILQNTATLEWDKAYFVSGVEELDFSLADIPDDNTIHDITLVVDAREVATSLTYSLDILWSNELVTDLGYIYEININSFKLAVWTKFGGGSDE